MTGPRGRRGKAIEPEAQRAERTPSIRADHEFMDAPSSWVGGYAGQRFVPRAVRVVVIFRSNDLSRICPSTDPETLGV